MEIEHISDSQVQIILYKSNIVKFISLFDTIINIIYFFYMPIYSYAGLFSIFFSIIGYYGANTLDKCNILIYLLYLIFINIYRIILFVLVITFPNYFNILTISSSYLILNILAKLISIFFLYYVFTLYNLIKEYQQYFLDIILKEPEYIVTVLNPV
jgi:hypothetical protein